MRISLSRVLPVQYIKDPLFQEVMYGVLVVFMVALDLELTLTQRSKVNNWMFVIGILM